MIRIRSSRPLMRTIISSLMILIILPLVSVEILAATETPNKGELKAIIKTNYGSMVAELYYKEAPIAVSNFIELARSKSFVDTYMGPSKFAEMIVFSGLNSQAQENDYFFQDDINDSLKLERGVLGMNTNSPHTNSNNFFIATGEIKNLQMTVLFGKLVEGLDLAKKVFSMKKSSMGGPQESAKILSVDIIGEFKPIKFYKQKLTTKSKAEAHLKNQFSDFFMNVGKNLDMGSVDRFKLISLRQDGGEQVNLEYRVKFEKGQSFRVILDGKTTEKGITLDRIRFREKN